MYTKLVSRLRNFIYHSPAPPPLLFSTLYDDHTALTNSPVSSKADDPFMGRPAFVEVAAY